MTSRNKQKDKVKTKFGIKKNKDPVIQPAARANQWLNMHESLADKQEKEYQRQQSEVQQQMDFNMFNQQFFRNEAWKSALINQGYVLSSAAHSQGGADPLFSSKAATAPHNPFKPHVTESVVLE